MLEEIVKEGGARLGLDLSENQLNQFRVYYKLLLEGSRQQNLTAITEENEAAQLHFLDSLAFLPTVRKDFDRGGRLIDIGTGAGFPGLPIKIALPKLEVTLLDAREKRIEFLKSVVSQLKLDGVICIGGRSEELSSANRNEEPNFRESFDIAVSRAVSEMGILCELSMPLVKKGGIFIAMKSVDTDDEIEKGRGAIKVLGGEIEGITDYKIPGTEIPRRVVIIRKTAETPVEYPRRYARIKKQPL